MQSLDTSRYGAQKLLRSLLSGKSDARLLGEYIMGNCASLRKMIHHATVVDRWSHSRFVFPGFLKGLWVDGIEEVGLETSKNEFFWLNNRFTTELPINNRVSI